MDKFPKLNREEKSALTLRAMYETYGYRKYRMQRFEEYGLYLENKSFLPSEHIIAFNDLSGRLMALKPDVTLSIVKNLKSVEGAVQKLYYAENVYRADKATKQVKEISQIGLEAMGKVDAYTVTEVVSLAVKSLCAIEDGCVLTISHVGLLSGAMEYCGLTVGQRERALELLVAKNVHELAALCADKGEILLQLAAIDDKLGEALQQVKPLCKNDKMLAAYAELNALYENTKGEVADRINLDFSVSCNVHYYNGIVFQGFVSRVPYAILAGGRYDMLADKFFKGMRAIGFALYLDAVAAFYPDEESYDVDVLLVYSKGVSVAAVNARVEELISSGLSVRAEAEGNTAVKYRTLEKMTEEVC